MNKTRIAELSARIDRADEISAALTAHISQLIRMAYAEGTSRRKTRQLMALVHKTQAARASLTDHACDLICKRTQETLRARHQQ